MSKGKFINQKLGKRTDRKSQLLKARLKVQPLPNPKRSVKPAGPKGPSRQVLTRLLTVRLPCTR